MVYYESIRSNIKTGDLILFSGNFTSSKVIKFFSKSKWTHIGIVIKFTEPFNYVALWESDAAIGGVQLTNLFARVKKYQGESAIRHLEDVQLTQNNLEDLKLLREQLKLRPYQTNKWEMLRACWDFGFYFGREQKRNLDSLFCSELVAETLQRLEILDPTISSNEFTPGDFSTENQNLPMLKGKYGPEIYLETGFK